MTKIAIENVNHPGKVERVDAGMYEAMKLAIMTVLPASSPGMTVSEVQDVVPTHLPRGAIPGRRQGWMVDEGRPARPRSEGPCRPRKDEAFAPAQGMTPPRPFTSRAGTASFGA